MDICGTQLVDGCDWCQSKSKHAFLNEVFPGDNKSVWWNFINFFSTELINPENK